MRQTATIMGMIISLDIPGCDDEQIFADTFAAFKDADERFSLYKPASELSCYRRGELKERELSLQMKKVIRSCREAEVATEGYFSAWASGEFDPSGYVKGWAIDLASRYLRKNGYKTFCLGAGGDIDAGSNGSKIWRIGLQDPSNRQQLLGRVAGKNIAVATSGTYERGTHIINPKTGQPAEELLGLSVAGPNIITADVLATAAFAAGRGGLDLVNQKKGYAALAIDNQGKLLMTPGMARLLQPA